MKKSRPQVARMAIMILEIAQENNALVDKLQEIGFDWRGLESVNRSYEFIRKEMRTGEGDLYTDCMLTLSPEDAVDAIISILPDKPDCIAKYEELQNKINDL